MIGIQNNSADQTLENIIVTDTPSPANGLDILTGSNLEFGSLEPGTGLNRRVSARVTAQVTSGMQVCNSAMGVALRDGEIVSSQTQEPVCLTIGESPSTGDASFEITKSYTRWEDTNGDDRLNAGDNVVFVINVQNTHPSEMLNSITVIDVADDTLVFMAENITGILDFGDLPPMTGFSSEIVMQIREGVTDNTTVCNTASALAYRNGQLVYPLVNNPTNPVCVNTGDTNPEGPGDPEEPENPEVPSEPDTDFLLDKSYSNWNDLDEDEMLSGGDEVQYLITVNNTHQSESLDDIIVTDVSDLGMVFVETNMSGILNFGTLAPQTQNELPITLQIQEGVPSGTELCNTASALAKRNGNNVYPALNNPTTPVCVTVGEPLIPSPPTNGGSGGGGGGAPTHPSIGTCAVHYSTGAFQCVPRYPVEDTDDPTYQAYRACIADDTQTIQSCLITWAATRDFLTCGDEIMGNIQIPFTGSMNADMIAQCDELIPNIGSGLPCTNGTNSTIRKEIKEVSGAIVDNTITARGNHVKYRVTLRIDGLEVPDITTGIMKIYDFTVPAESGNIWNRNGFISSGWSWNTGGRYYERPLTSGEIAALNADNFTQITLEYEMNTELATSFDTANIKNIAFAVMEYNSSSLYGIGNACGISGLDPYGIFSSSTLGDEANVNIIRPFVEVRGGDVGLKFSDNSRDRITGDVTQVTGSGTLTSGEIFVENEYETDPGKQYLNRFGTDPRQAVSDLSSFEKFSGGAESDIFYENLKLNLDLSNTYSYFGLDFVTTMNESGVYFLDPNSTSSNIPRISSDLDLGDTSKTFVIEGRDLIIGDILGTTPNYTIDGYAAFIVRNANVQIAPHVQSIEGIFISENGNISATEIYDSGSGMYRSEVSELPLSISGMLVGDMGPLFRSRRYIGLNPNTTLEPNVKINFDLRTLSQTPPALEKFLGGDWIETMD